MSPAALQLLAEQTPLRDYQRAANTLEAGRVARYHAAPTVAPQTVGHHSWGVAVLCLYVTGGEASRELIIQALVHDAAELHTGDVPFTVKRDLPEVKGLFRDLEAHAHRCLVMDECSLNPHDAAVLTLCDTVEGLIWCRKTEQTGLVRERWRGALNRAFEKFAGVCSEKELWRAAELVNEENFYPTI